MTQSLLLNMKSSQEIVSRQELTSQPYRRGRVHSAVNASTWDNSSGGDRSGASAAGLVSVGASAGEPETGLRYLSAGGQMVCDLFCIVCNRIRVLGTEFSRLVGVEASSEEYSPLVELQGMGFGGVGELVL
jgi:hypothetical protein